jgi:hypothetical protein
MTPRERATQLANWMNRHNVPEQYADAYEACDECIAEAERQITEALQAQREAAWQPIETAPKDGTWFLAYSPNGNWRRISWGRNRHHELCWCAADYWWLETERQFTHWQPLPTPPAADVK